jgi:diamine N-acetyltransferase
MNLSLREITAENWRECVRLKTSKDQERFVAPNVYSLAQSKYEPYCRPTGIYDDETMVGFVMYAQDPDDQQYWIYRFMIGEAYQGRGYGRAGMLAIIKLLQENYNITELALSYEPDNIVAENLYLSLGFEKTGEVVQDEVVARFKLAS